MKRKDYLGWDEYFMGVALLSSQRSKDPNTQVGACVVNADNRIVSIGYNGMPYGCDDDVFPWAREGSNLESKYMFVCHAEINAILNFNGGSLENCRLYTTLFPCNECAKAIVQKHIKEVVYLSDKYEDTDMTRAARMIFNAAGVTCRKYELSKKTAELKL